MMPVCFAKINVSAQAQLSHVPGHMRSKDKYNWEPRWHYQLWHGPQKEMGARGTKGRGPG